MAGKTDVSSELRFLDGKRAEMAAALKDWCAVNTGSRNLNGLAAMRALLAEAFSALGADVEIARAAPQSVVRANGDIVEEEIGDSLRLVVRPQAPVRVLLAGHMDTVFASDHPFQNGKLLDADTYNAPGGADLKGGLLVMLYALMALERSSLADRVGYEVIINADEEIGSPGSARLIEAAAKRAQSCARSTGAPPPGPRAAPGRGRRASSHMKASRSVGYPGSSGT